VSTLDTLLPACTERRATVEVEPGCSSATSCAGSTIRPPTVALPVAAVDFMDIDGALRMSRGHRTDGMDEPADLSRHPDSA
jgi:hypothetical protein